MDSDTFVKWLFTPKDSGAMSDPDLSSPSPSESNPTNAPSDPNQAAENAVTEELKRIDLQGSCSIEVERDSTGDAENGEQAEEVKEVRNGGEDDDDDDDDDDDNEVIVKEQSENGNWSKTDKEDKYSEGETLGGPEEKDPKYLELPVAVDCPYYMRTGTCKFGYNCRFNHPNASPRKLHQAGRNEADHGEPANRNSWQIECKYYLSPGGCKFGKACNFSHSRTNLPAPTSTTELNFLGLPIRPGEQKCVYFMRTGTCKYAANCRFNHPDPTSTAGSDNPKHPMEYGSSSSRLESPPPRFPASATSWAPPAAGLVNDSAPRFVPMMYSSSLTQSPKAEWNNGYQFPVKQAAAGQSSSMAPCQPYAMYANNPQQQHHMVMNEYPERPGQPECTFFMRNGDCKFKSNCKFHHPKERISKSPHHAAAAFSNHGLQLRTDQKICTHYSRYGICRFGDSCKFDHPVKVDDASNFSRDRRIDEQQYAFSSSSRATTQSGDTWSSSRPQVITL